MDINSGDTKFSRPLSLFRSLLDWLSRQSASRLLAYTRQVERERDWFKEQLRLEREIHKETLIERDERYEAAEKNWNQERRQLIDRICDKQGLRPITEQPKKENIESIVLKSPLRQARAEAEAKDKKMVEIKNSLLAQVKNRN